MKIGVVSDSHGNLDYLKKAADALVKEKVDLIIHLGDDYDDVKALDKLSVKIIQVPGVFSGYYKDPKIPNRVIERFGRWRVLLSHTLSSHENDLPGDLKPEELVRRGLVNVVLYGHTHIPELHIENEILFVNPGHLKLEDKKGYKASFAILDFGKTVQAKIISIDGEEKARMSFP